MSYEFAPAGYSLATATAAAKARRARMTGDVPDEGIMSSREYSRLLYDRWRAKRQAARKPKAAPKLIAPSNESVPEPIEICPTVVPLFGDNMTFVNRDNAVRITKIVDVVAKFYGVTKVDILSARRWKSIIHARQVAAYLAKRITLKSLPEIGRRLGRDHTTIL